MKSFIKEYFINKQTIALPKNEETKDLFDDGIELLSEYYLNEEKKYKLKKQLDLLEKEFYLLEEETKKIINRIEEINKHSKSYLSTNSYLHK